MEPSSHLGELDISVFDEVPSQTIPGDRQSILAVQDAVRGLVGTYNYLETGSRLGSSIQPFLLDDQCAHITSVDLRPPSQPDERGGSCAYPENSTQRMLDNHVGYLAAPCANDENRSIARRRPVRAFHRATAWMTGLRSRSSRR